ncbi:MAG TPA: Sua5/YciO/YrdC/YwlC family protein, partial [Solirubrobacter sp.]
HLLLADVGAPLVMTSGNVSDEPIAFENDDALERLGGIADAFLLHDRPIHTRVDDSVLRGGRIVRRSRGYVPATLPVSSAPPLLAVGAELKSTFALARDGRAWVSHHIGDLRNYETLRSLTDGVAHFERLFAVTPELVAHDLHPEYLSTKFALDLDLPAVGVQHHHAHLAACLAEHGVESAAGAIYDGTGYGTDGTVWGGELLRGDLTDFTRLGSLWPVRMPGGEAAIREPWRMACAWLLEIGHDVPEEWTRVAQLVRTGLNSPLTSSMGRLFDAVAALCGLRATVTYEGQAAVELEALADRHETAAYPLDTTCTQPVYRGQTPVYDLDARLVLDARPTVAAVAEDVARGVDVALVSARFHNAVARATAQALRDEPVVVLSGGVFQNELLLVRTLELLPRALTPRKLPVNDGGIAYGQAAIAARRARSRTP